ncbi:MAG: sensor histidine kinase, partial [Candidatus Zixiibacteriota bacterium]
IGLALVRDVAEAHGGMVTLASRVWKGSVFEIRIPLIRPETESPAGEGEAPSAGETNV